MYSCIYEARMSPALDGSSAIWHFKHSNAIEICNGITFDFYTGLPHIARRQIAYLDPIGDKLHTLALFVSHSVTGSNEFLYTVCFPHDCRRQIAYPYAFFPVHSTPGKDA